MWLAVKLPTSNTRVRYHMTLPVPSSQHQGGIPFYCCSAYVNRAVSKKRFVVKTIAIKM